MPKVDKELTFARENLRVFIDMQKKIDGLTEEVKSSRKKAARVAKAAWNVAEHAGRIMTYINNETVFNEFMEVVKILDKELEVTEDGKG